VQLRSAKNGLISNNHFLELDENRELELFDKSTHSATVLLATENLNSCSLK
jgi:hypothetical protein